MSKSDVVAGSGLMVTVGCVGTGVDLDGRCAGGQSDGIGCDRGNVMRPRAQRRVDENYITVSGAVGGIKPSPMSELHSTEMSRENLRNR